MAEKYHDTPEQEAIIGETMKKFKEGKLKARGGKVITDEKEAMAIALKEAKVPPKEEEEKGPSSKKVTKPPKEKSSPAAKVKTDKDKETMHKTGSRMHTTKEKTDKKMK